MYNNEDMSSGVNWTMKKIFLCSGSPRRKELLQQMGLQFEVFAADVDENVTEALSPSEYVQYLALKKAQRAAEILKEGVLIAADTIVTLDQEILGKPVDEEEAVLMLKKLSGKNHSVYTGVVVLDLMSKKTLVQYKETLVTMRPYTIDEIQRYVKTKEPFDKAGAYGIQGYGALLVEKIDGDYFNVMGLSVSMLNQMLKEVGVRTII